MTKFFTHNTITTPLLERVDTPGLRYYRSPRSSKKFTSITTIISHNSKHKFVDWRKEKGEREANRITKRSTKRGTKMHTLIENYVSNHDLPTVDELFTEADDEKILQILNPFDRIRAKSNKINFEVFRQYANNKLKVNLSCNSRDSYEVLSLIRRNFTDVSFEDGTDQDAYNKTIIIDCLYDEFTSFCLENFSDATLSQESVESYRNLPYYMFNNLKHELDKIDNILGIEIPLHSEYLSIAGTSDCIAEYNGRLSIIDYKTSDYIKKKDWIFDYFVQAVAYRYMLKELTGLDAEQLVVLMAAENGETAAFVETDFTPYSRRLIQYIDKFTNDKRKEIEN